MAVVKDPNSCSMKLRYQNGVNAKGDPVYLSRSFSNVKTTATDQAIFDVAQAINSLQDTPLVAVHRVDDGELISQ